jgi:hypothetical protein
MAGRGEEVCHMLEEQLTHLHMDLDTHYEEVASSGRSLLLLLLHLFLHLPNLIPKTRVEFQGDLGTPINKGISINNPSRRAIEYSVSLTGSQDFTCQGVFLVIPAESSAQFVVTLNARFVEEVGGLLTFWSEKDSGLSGTTVWRLCAMCYVLCAMCLCAVCVYVVCAMCYVLCAM